MTETTSMPCDQGVFPGPATASTSGWDLSLAMPSWQWEHSDYDYNCYYYYHYYHYYYCQYYYLYDAQLVIRVQWSWFYLLMMPQGQAELNSPIWSKGKCGKKRKGILCKFPNEEAKTHCWGKNFWYIQTFQALGRDVFSDWRQTWALSRPSRPAVV